MAVSLSKDKILEAAIVLADSEGIGALSMRKLADALGVKAMSLYNHLANKDAIIDGIVDKVVGEITVPSVSTDTDWKGAMLARGNSAHEVLLRHPWATQTIVSRINIGANMLRYIDATLGCLRGAGFSIEMSDHVWNALDNHIYGFTLQELNFPIENDAYAETAENYLDLIPFETYPHLHELSLVVMKGKYDGQHDFEFGLRLMLDRLDVYRQ